MKELIAEKTKHTDAINAARAYMDENIHPTLNSLKSEETKVREVLDKQKKEKEKFVR